MNHWTEMSIRYANQRNYLDSFFQIYPAIPDGIRAIEEGKWNKVEEAFEKQDNKSMITALFQLDKFPIKDPYVAYMRRDGGSIERNPHTNMPSLTMLFRFLMKQNSMPFPSPYWMGSFTSRDGIKCISTCRIILNKIS